MKLTIEHNLTPAELAEAFCEMTDEQQAQFFIEAARISRSWKNNNGMQWFYVGKHLRTCECSTDDARDMVREIAEAAE